MALLKWKCVHCLSSIPIGASVCAKCTRPEPNKLPPNASAVQKAAYVGNMVSMGLGIVVLLATAFAFWRISQQ